MPISRRLERRSGPADRRKGSRIHENFSLAEEARKRLLKITGRQKKVAGAPLVGVVSRGLEGRYARVFEVVGEKGRNIPGATRVGWIKVDGRPISSFGIDHRGSARGRRSTDQ